MMEEAIGCKVEKTQGCIKGLELEDNAAVYKAVICLELSNYHHFINPKIPFMGKLADLKGELVQGDYSVTFKN